MQRHAWQEAYDTLVQADRTGSLPADGLQLLAWAAWWTAHPDETIEALERAYGAYLQEGDRSAAAMMAFRLAEQHGMRLAIPMARGWMTQAERLAEEDPDSPVHGWLAWMRPRTAGRSPITRAMGSSWPSRTLGRLWHAPSPFSEP